MIELAEKIDDITEWDWFVYKGDGGSVIAAQGNYGGKCYTQTVWSSGKTSIVRKLGDCPHIKIFWSGNDQERIQKVESKEEINKYLRGDANYSYEP